MKKRYICIGLLLMLLLTAVFLISCRSEKNNVGEETMPPYGETASELVRLDAYTELSVERANESVPKSEAIWQEILRKAEITAYPEAQVSYYVRQIQGRYRHYAEQKDMKYEELLATLSVTEESILTEAREMVKGDLVYRYIAKDAKIVLTEEEKSKHFPRYQAKFAADYGYTEAYIAEHMTEEIYDAMLYDKTMEYLVLNNTCTTGGQ